MPLEDTPHCTRPFTRHVADCIICTCLCFFFRPSEHICFSPYAVFCTANSANCPTKEIALLNKFSGVFVLIMPPTPSHPLLLRLRLGLWQYLLHYAQTCSRENHKLFFLTDVLMLLIHFSLAASQRILNL